MPEPYIPSELDALDMVVLGAKKCPKTIQLALVHDSTRRGIEEFMAENNIASFPEALRYLVLLGLKKTPLEAAVVAGHQRAYNETTFTLRRHVGQMVRELDKAMEDV